MDNKPQEFIYKWITIQERPEYQTPGKKTKVFFVINNDTRTQLAKIHYDTGWRRYVAQFAPHCIFEQDCLRDIISFLDKLAMERKLELHNKKHANGTNQF